MDEHLLAKKVAEYVPSPEAAQLYSVTNDYIARLCRQGKLKGILEGRVWMVERESLKTFFDSRALENGTSLMEKPVLLSSVDAARLYEVTNDYIARLCRQGKLDGVMERGVWMVKKSSLDAFFSESRG